MKTLTLVLTIMVFFVIGCRLGDLLRGGAQGGSNSSRPSSSAGADPKAEVIAASKKFIDLPAFSAKMEGTGQTAIKSQVDYVAPDRYHIMYLGGTGAGMEMIMIGNDSYMKTGGKWIKMPGSGSGTIPTLRDSFTDEGLKSLSDVKYAGPDTINGKAASVYTYNNVTPKGDYPFSSRIWISQDTGVPMKIVVDYANGVLKQMTVNYDTEAPVTIEAPVR